MFTVVLFGTKLGEAANVELADETGLVVQYDGFKPGPWFKELIDAAIADENSDLKDFEYDPATHTIVSINIAQGIFTIWSGDSNDNNNDVDMLKWNEVFSEF